MDPGQDARDDGLALGMRALRRQLLRAYTNGLGDASWRVRKKAARGLGELGPEAVEAVPLLEVALRDRHPQVREAAAAALQKIQPAPPQ